MHCGKLVVVVVVGASGEVEVKGKEGNGGGEDCGVLVVFLCGEQLVTREALGKEWHSSESLSTHRDEDDRFSCKHDCAPIDHFLCR